MPGTYGFLLAREGVQLAREGSRAAREGVFFAREGSRAAREGVLPPRALRGGASGLLRLAAFSAFASPLDRCLPIWTRDTHPIMRRANGGSLWREVQKAMQYSVRTLEETPVRVLRFFTGLRDTGIRELVQQNGLTHALLEIGRQRLFTVVAGEPPVLTPEAIANPGFAELVSWDERNFAVLRAAITFYSPSGAEWVFQGLSAQSDYAGSIRAVSTALDRVEKFLAGQAGAPAAPAELPGSLEALGFGQAERQRIAGLVVDSLSPEALDEPDDSDGEELDEEQPTAAFVAQLLELRLWFDLAAAIARKAGLKRYQLIRLGLAQRKTSSKSTPAPTPENA